MLPQGNLRIYGCGGAGINIATRYEKSADNPEAGFATGHPVYLDTSRSNVTDQLDESRFMILEGLDGSGKVRRENHEAISKSVKSILQQHKPLDFNVVIFSASGGSGSVFGPLVVSELLSRNLPVIAIVIGSSESAITAQNSLNTIKSLEAIAERNKLPVVMYYDHNSPSVKRSEVDRNIATVIGLVSALVSRQNRELDTMDLLNWLHFSKHSSVRARLAVLTTHLNNEEVADAKNPIAIASLYNNPDIDPIEIRPDYHCAGYRIHPSEHFEAVHFAISVDKVQDVAKELQATVDELDNQRRSRVDHNSLVNNSDDVTDSGLVL